MDRSNFDPQVGDSVRIRSWEDMESEFGIDEDGISHANFPLPNI